MIEDDATHSSATRHIRGEWRGAIGVIREALQRAARSSALGAFVRLHDDGVTRAARKAPRGPLHGLPFAVKDNVHVAGAPTTAGSAGLIANRTQSDAWVVARLRTAGAVPFGKTAMNEFAMGWSGQNRIFGPVRNPLDASRTAGGSSGGSASAVASGIVPIALGTDTNGSIRVPAAFCGVVGYRPSTGRYPTTGVVPLSRTLDTVGFLTRRVADLQLLDDVLRNSRPAPRPNRTTPAFVIDPEFFDGTADGVSASLDAAIRALRDSGSVVVEASTGLAALVKGIAPRLIGSEAWSAISAYSRARDIDPDHLLAAAGREVATALRQTADSEYSGLHRASSRARTTLVAALDRYRADAIVLPTVLIEAPLIDERFDLPAADPIVAGRRVSAREVYGRNVALASVTGAPAVTLPVTTASGLSAGVEIVGRPGFDRRLLRTAAAVEAQLRRSDIFAARP